MQNASKQVDVIFFRSQYRELFWHCVSTVPGWLSQVVLGNAQAESDGSAKLLRLWQDVNFNKAVEKEILIHAIDEARHSKLFVKLVKLAFPSLFPPSFLARFKSNLTTIDSKVQLKSDTPIDTVSLIDHLVQMNMGEIRTRLHLDLIAPVLHEITPDESKNELEHILQGLGHDEIKHISYIALILEEMCADGDEALICDLYIRRLRDFNEFTLNQTKSTILDFGQGRFNALLMRD